MPLTLADWDRTDLAVEAGALLEVSGVPVLYADADRGGDDAPVEGELGIGPDVTVISRIQWLSGPADLVLNDNDNPGVLSLNGYFGSNGAGADLTLYIVTDDGSGSVAVSRAYGFGGGGYARLTGIPAAMATLLDGLEAGDRFIIGFARSAVVSLAGRALAAVDVRAGLAIAFPLDLAARALVAVTVRAGLVVISPLDLAARAAAMVAARVGLAAADLAPVDLAARAPIVVTVRADLAAGDRSLDLAARAGAAATVRAGLRVALASEFGAQPAAAAAAGAARAVLARTGDRVLDGAESATQRLRDALLITRGSYPAARDYGSLLAVALDRSLGSSGVGELANAVADAIAHPANGLADVRLRSVRMTAEDGVVVLDIQADWVSHAGTLTPIGLREQLAAG